MRPLGSGFVELTRMNCSRCSSSVAPAIASTPVILNDRIVLREVNSHGGNEGQAKHLVYLDKATGKTLTRKYAGHVDYRTQHAPVATNGKYMVYPFGKHDIYDSPAICQNFNRLNRAGNQTKGLSLQFLLLTTSCRKQN